MEVVNYYFRKCDECSKGISQGIWAEDELVCSKPCADKLWGKMNPFTTIDLEDGSRKGISLEEFLVHIESIDDDDRNCFDIRTSSGPANDIIYL